MTTILIKRPYFHVKPLEREQLRNWYAYLDFEIRTKKKSRILFLFERCMIACANYEEMWIKFANYLLAIDDNAAARSIYKREAGNPDYSGLVAKYERLIQEAATTSRKIASFWALKLARFHTRFRHDRKLAKKVLKEAISKDKDNVQLYLALVDLAYSSSHSRDSEIVAAFDAAIDSKDLSAEERFQFSMRKLEFLEELGNDVGRVTLHIEKHLAFEKSFEIAPSMTIFHGKKMPLHKEIVPQQLRFFLPLIDFFSICRWPNRLTSNFGGFILATFGSAINALEGIRDWRNSRHFWARIPMSINFLSKKSSNSLPTLSRGVMVDRHEIFSSARLCTNSMATTTATTTTTQRLDPTTGWTCLACQLVFSSGQLQREHYRNEWHLYNMKRQIANLPPVTERDFLDKLQHFAQHQTNDDSRHSIAAATGTASALPTFNLSSSLVCASRRHKEAAEEDGGQMERKNVEDDKLPKVAEEDVSSENDEDGHEANKEDGIPPNECLFCEHKSGNWEANLEHMAIHHGFSIPDFPFCTDTPGLLIYLGFKIGVGLTCIRCQCARFRSLDALRKHMRDSNHCNFRIDCQQEGDVLLEFMDFYDYSEQCDEEATGGGDEAEQQQMTAVLDDEGAFLVLPSGARIGHRSLVRYFRQRFSAGSRPDDWHFQRRQMLLANAKKSDILKQLGGGPASAASCCPLPVLAASLKARARDVSFMKRTVERLALRRQMAANKLFRSRGRDDQQ
uniref:C2H2-type domain-containing protein n=1 Tax=Globodera rostochiensis TaxID=31243 RepID=A0A914H9B9_GLORO